MLEAREFLDQTDQSAGVMSLAFDIPSGVVRSVGKGVWSYKQATAFFEEWKLVVSRVHLAGRSVSALVDMSNGQVQRAEVADLIMRATAGLYRGGDAIAMLVPSSLAKMQMRRVLDGAFHQFFLSERAAELWLISRTAANESLAFRATA